MKRLNLSSLNRQARAAQAGEEFHEGCTGKTAYPSGIQAAEAAADLKRSGAARKASSYRCRHCGLWHVTSHAKGKR
jgi:hypothetical protein